MLEAYREWLRLHMRNVLGEYLLKINERSREANALKDQLAAVNIKAQAQAQNKDSVAA